MEEISSVLFASNRTIPPAIVFVGSRALASGGAGHNQSLPHDRPRPDPVRFHARMNQAVRSGRVFDDYRKAKGVSRKIIKIRLVRCDYGADIRSTSPPGSGPSGAGRRDPASGGGYSPGHLDEFFLGNELAALVKRQTWAAPGAGSPPGPRLSRFFKAGIYQCGPIARQTDTMPP